MRRHDARNLPGDLFAGMTLWAVFAAQAIAYSRLAHTTPTAGLVTALSALTLMTAGFLLLGRLLRVSFLQRLFPTPVFVGYIAGTGITIVVGQGREIVTGGWPVLVIGPACPSCARCGGCAAPTSSSPSSPGSRWC